jgi:hypothetical protein
MGSYEFSGEGMEHLVATCVALLMRRGDARSVAILTFGVVRFEPRGEDFGVTYWSMVVGLPVAFYAQLSADDRSSSAEAISNTVAELLSAHDDTVRGVRIVPAIQAPPDRWRAEVAKWLTGEGVTNQGRVRSTNPAPLEHEGLLFRSRPEIQLFQAFKSRGVYFAPLPVFLRGGTTYRRLEPDFFVVQEGRAMIVEIDGATVHTESPAEADERLRALKREGIFVERRRADECDTPESASQCATDLLAGFEQWRRSSR